MPLKSPNFSGFGARTITVGTIESQDATSVQIDLGDDAGDDFIVDTDKLVVEGDNGLVGIGTAEPATALHVKSETGDTAIKVQAGSVSDTDGAAQVTFSSWQRTASIGLMSTDIIIAKDSSIDPMSGDRRVTISVDSGNVGIGHKFGQHRQPEGSVSASVLSVENTTTSGSAQGGNIRLSSNDDAAMESGHRLGVIEFAGSEAASPGPAGSAMAVGARIEAVTNAIWSTTENGATLDFYTTDGDAVQTKQMTISATGNVGIGPTAPAKNLHVSKASGESTFRLQSAGYYSDFIQNGANLFIQNAAGSGNIIFYDDAAERMRIDTDGNVGIGDNDPGTTLQLSSTTTAFTMKNTTAENTDGGCESKIIFEDHDNASLAVIQGSHDGSSDDTKGDLIFSTHTGSGLTEAMRIDSAQETSFSGVVSLTKDVALNNNPSDENTSGVTAAFIAGEALSRGECVYLKAADSKMWKAVATASATSRCIAMAAEDMAADAGGVFLLQGFLRDDGTLPAYTIGGVIYTPEAETGGENVPEQTAPDTSGDFVQVIGWAYTANILYFNPSGDVIEVA